MALALARRPLLRLAGASRASLPSLARVEPCSRRWLSASRSFAAARPPTTVLGRTYEADDYTNVPSSILSRIAPQPTLLYAKHHPLAQLRERIERLLPLHTPIAAPSAVVDVDVNFGSLGFPADHPGRAPSDTYYLNRSTCLRTHTSAHEVQVFADGHTRWLLTADVYRRDEIDASHYPVFHQVEGAAVWSLEDFAPGGVVEKECEALEAQLANASIRIEDSVDLDEAGGWQAEHTASPELARAAALSLRHLKGTLNMMALQLFGPRHAADVAAAARARGAEGGAAAEEHEPLHVRWIAASFPFTSPSLEVEVWFRGKWLEILGCGVVMEQTLVNAKVPGKVGWAFGLGLERIAMVLHSIPDIRLFWSQDARFLSQFANVSAGSSAAGGLSPSSPSSLASQRETDAPALVTFQPYSKYPACLKDISFWLPADGTFHANDVAEVVRDEAQDLAEHVQLIDEFTHPKSGRRSQCYRINYRSMDRNLQNDEINALHQRITERLVAELHIEPR